ncbi:hypothetical protein F2Q69_00025022 [Brassica cretica]|uniref:Uncharacterized protein n=1 Tax=Brassica cretica TaxID=69181 RepID=A0A8S9Q973_BRACR|nr:hypothetical protein F2Q69_00025022 [Brassica cretica]
MVTLGDEDGDEDGDSTGDSLTTPTAALEGSAPPPKESREGVSSPREGNRSPWTNHPPVEPLPSPEAVNGVGESSNSRKVKVLQKDKEIAVATETPDVEINGDGQVRYAITLNLNVVSDLLHELEVIPPALGNNVVGDKSREKFEVGGTSGGDMNTDALKLDWALAGRNPSPPTDRVRVTGAKEFDQVEGDMVNSPSRFSVLAIEDNEERDGDADDDIEEAEVVSEW